MPIAERKPGPDGIIPMTVAANAFRFQPLCMGIGRFPKGNVFPTGSERITRLGAIPQD